MKPKGTLLRAAASLLLAFFGGSAIADDPAGGVIGVGQMSCGEFAGYDHQPSFQSQMRIFAEWSQGFISAYNLRNVLAPNYQAQALKPVPPPDEPTVLLYIRSYCDKNPLSNVTNATLSMIAALGGVTSGTITFPQKSGQPGG